MVMVFHCNCALVTYIEAYVSCRIYPQIINEHKWFFLEKNNDGVILTRDFFLNVPRE